MKKFLFAAAMGLTTLTAAPAFAQAYEAPPSPPEGYYDEGYAGSEEWAADGAEVTNGYAEVGDGYAEVEVRTTYSSDDYRGAPRRYRRGDYYQGDGVAYNGGRHRDRRYRERRCSGTTGAILGGIAGALIGGDIGGRQGRYRYHRSGTGTVVGAGVGAVIGSEIDRSSCEDNRRYDR